MILFWHKLKSFLAKFLQRFKTTKVKAVYDSDLIGLVESLGIKKAIESGSYTCKFCGTTICFENLQAIQKDGGELKFICTNPECFSKI